MRIEHAVTNIIGVVVAHIFAQRAKKIEDAKLKARTNLLGVVISLADHRRRRRARRRLGEVMNHGT